MNKKGIEPVIAIVIIIAVAIALAIAVAYWVLGLIPAFTRYEDMKIVNAYISNQQNACIIIKNTGTTDITVIAVFINGRENDTTHGWARIVDISAGLNSLSPVDLEFSLTLSPGQTEYILVNASAFSAINNQFSSGVTYEFSIRTAAGGAYPITVRAP